MHKQGLSFRKERRGKEGRRQKEALFPVYIYELG